MLYFFMYSALINACISGFFGLFILIKNNRDKLNRLFFLMTIPIVAWSLSYWQWIKNMINNNYYGSLFWVNLLSLASIFIPVIYFHWIIYLVKKQEENKVLLTISYSMAIFISFFTFTKVFIKDVEQKLFFPYWPIPGILYTIYIITLYCGLITYSWILLLKKIRSSTGIENQMLKYVLAGSIVGFGGGGTNFFLWYNIPFAPWGNILVFLYPLILGIAILVYQLFNIRTILTEFSIFWLWVFTFFRFILDSNPEEKIIDGILFLLAIIFGILLIRSVYQEVNQKEELAKLNKKLEHQYNLRGKILSIISHQVKSPLINIKEFVRFLIEGNYGQLPEKAIEILKRVDKNVKEGIDLTSDLGDFRRIEENKSEYQFSYFNLSEIVRDVCEFYEPFAKEKNLELKCNILPDQLNIQGDKEKLRQVLANLVDNAIKYTDQGYIEISVQKNENEILITVEDTGCGINKENLESIFEEFVNLDISKKTILGTGLGLYISKHIVEAHNGKIWAESEGEGKGSKFYVKLPLDSDKS